jgi:hypothetical protein
LELQQGPAVVDQLKAFTQAAEGGVFQPGGLGWGLRLRLWRGGMTAGAGCPAAAGGGHGLLAGSSPLPEASMSYWAIHTGSLRFGTKHQGIQFNLPLGQCQTDFSPRNAWNAPGI